ncbi:MAG: hypothetical protein ACOX41_09795 [Anaerovoracaceae bacterium]|jgi:predicted HicB family RNase H-like nuclease
MQDRLEYRAYTGSVEYSEKERRYHGKIMGIADHVSYDGADEEELAEEFEAAVDLYIILCQDAGRQPDRISHAN